MRTTFSYVAVENYLSRQAQPEEYIDPEPGCRAFYIATQKADGAFGWRHLADGPKVRVPLLPYCSVGKDAENAIGHAFQLGFRAACSAVRHAGPVLRMHLSVGAPVEELDGHLLGAGGPVDCYRYWIGVCVFVR